MNDIVTILLLGYRATGKSTCGKLLAQRLGWGFVDMDEVLRRRLGQDINEVVRERGWGAFRAEEYRLLKEIITSTDYRKCVVATGGGVVLHRELLEDMPPHILTIWLKASPATISKRMSLDKGTEKNRPSLTGSKDPISEVREVLLERTPLYSHFSKMTIEVDDLTPEETIERILHHAR